MKKFKKQWLQWLERKRWLEFILGIVLIGIVLNQMGLLSVWGSSYQLSCAQSSTGWDCNAYGNSGGNLASQVIDDKTLISISQPSKYQIYDAMVLDTTKKFSGINFYDYICDKNENWCTAPYSRSNPPKMVQSEQQQFYVKDLVGNQIMIIEGNVLEMNGDDTRNAKPTGQTIKFYAFGNIDRRDWKVIDPFPNDNTKLISPTSFKIYVKKGGYTENDLCSSFQINCPITKTFYRFENNKCSEILILEKDKTGNDFEILSECQSKIQTEGSGEDTTEDAGDTNTKDEITDEETKKTGENKFLFWIFIVSGIVLVIGLIWLFLKIRR